jgi:hypothetical protein
MNLIKRVRDKIASWLVDDTSKLMLSFNYSGYLVDTGWIKSAADRTSVDGNGDPIPWVTYSFIDFFKGKQIADFSILEFGAGSSTLFWYKYTNTIFSIEHDEEWFHKVRQQLPSQFRERLLLKPLDGSNDDGYTKAGSQLQQRFDVIFVDGRERIKCAVGSHSSLSDRGVIILDDSERERYKEVSTFYFSLGFKRLDFWGIAPGIFNSKCTSIFYRPDNIFDI